MRDEPRAPLQGRFPGTSWDFKGRNGEENGEDRGSLRSPSYRLSGLPHGVSDFEIAAIEGEDLKLPGVENAVVDPKKIREYLLSASHPLGRFKASFFLSLGYTGSNWNLLAKDLRSFAERQEAELSARNDYGQKYLVRGILKGPSGRSAEIVTVWIILSGEVVPRFVTAFPGGDQ